MIIDIIKNNVKTIKYFSGKMILGIIGFVLVSMYTFLFDPEIYGDFSLIIGIINALKALFIGIVGSAAARYYTENKAQKYNFLLNIFLFWLIMTVTVTLILYLTVQIVFGNAQNHMLSYAIVAFVVLGLVQVYNGLIQSSNYSNLFLIGSILQAIFNISTFYIAKTYFNMGIEAIFMGIIISNSMFILLATWRFKSWRMFKKPKIFQISVWKRMLGYSFPMMGMWGLGWILDISDRYIIRIFQTSYQVGLYDINYKLIGNLMYMLETAFTMSVFSEAISAWDESGYDKTAAVIEKYLEYYLVIAVPTVIGFISIRNMMYGTILSMEYSHGNDVIIFAGIGLLFNGMFYIYHMAWKVMERTVQTMHIMMFSVALNLGLNFLFIPHFGYISAAVTTMITFLTSYAIVAYQTHQLFMIHLKWQKIINIIASALVMYFYVVLIEHRFEISSVIRLLVLCCSAGVVYFITLYLLSFLGSVIVDSRHQE